MSDNNEQPYIIKIVEVEVKSYNPKYGDHRVCKCGHDYGRHFDSYDDMDPIGCKYCICDDFIENAPMV